MQRINREILLWLKAWDGVVFGAKPEVTEPKKRLIFGEKQSPARFAGRVPLDESGAPMVKIVLLSGGAGFGKTTLAQVVARHAGYNPFEINASDDRTAPLLIQKMRDATEMVSVFGSGKPNLLILDEIDGLHAVRLFTAFFFRFSGRMLWKRWFKPCNLRLERRREEDSI